jgi:glutathione S-transferase
MAAAAAAGQQQPLVLYDISSPLQPRSYAPNPSKSRLALGFKGVPFATTWVDILDIPAVRQGLACKAVRKLDDGSDFFTLPMLRDPASGRVIGDSFEIACYLDAAFPDAGAGRLFPPGAAGVGLDYESPARDTPFYAPLTLNEGAPHAGYARFNVHVDATFSANMAPAAEGLPFNPATADAVRALFAKRAHLKSWDDLKLRGDARAAALAAFEAGTATLAACFDVNLGGPYLEGATPSYADLVVGGWLNCMSVTLPAGEWAAMKAWHGGAFGRLHDALQEHFFVLT